MDATGRLIVVTGVMAAGKSAVARELAERFDPSIVISGDALRCSVVRGAAATGSPPSAEFLDQVRLRHRAALAAAQTYAAAGFTAVLHDILVGPPLDDLLAAVTVRPAFLVVLDPDAATVAARDAARATTGYRDGWDPAEFVDALRTGTTRVGLWLDTGALSVEETVDAVVGRLDEADLAHPGATRA